MAHDIHHQPGGGGSDVARIWAKSTWDPFVLGAVAAEAYQHGLASSTLFHTLNVLAAIALTGLSAYMLRRILTV